MMDESDARRQEANAAPDHGAALHVKGIVEVERRMWPGINKQGGIGRVTKLHTQQEEDGRSTVTHVDVHYIVLGCRERHVPVRYVKVRADYDVEPVAATEPDAKRARNNLRDRSMLLGRCKKCGSLRQDCGSCDWIEEERKAEEAKRQQDNHGETHRPKRKHKRAVQQQNLDDSSSSDESLLMQIRRLRRRKAQLDRMKKPRFMDSESSSDPLSSSDEGDPFLSRLVKLKQSTSKRKSSVPANRNDMSSSSDESNHLLRNLPQPSTFRRKVTGRTKHGGSVDSKRAKRRKRVIGAAYSTLEHLRESKSDSAPREEVPLPSSSSESDSMLLSRSSHRPHSRKTISSHQLPGFVGEIGDPDTTPSRASSELMSQDDASTMDGSLQATPESQGPKHMDDFMQSLDDFIQPEGDKVAENLPEDTKDKTASLLYAELPGFFDRTTAELEVSLPNTKTLVQKILQRLEQAHSLQGDDKRDELRKIEKESSALYNSLKQQLIRDGMDQCRLALKRLGDERERRKHRDVMTKEQYKQCKKIEMREIRYETLDNEAESIMGTVRRILRATGATNIQDQPSDESYSSDGTHGNSVDLNTQELRGPEPGFAQGQAEENDISLPPFDPHMHASRVKARNSRKREKKRYRESTVARRSRKGSKSAPTDTAGSRARSNHHVGRRQKGSRKERRRRSSTSDDEDSQHTDCSDSSSASILFHAASPRHDTGTENNGVEQPGTRFISIPSLESILSREDATAAAFAVGNGVAGNGRAPNNRAGINDRMQAFLDKNESNINCEPWAAAETLPRPPHGKSSTMSKSRRRKERQTQKRTQSRTRANVSKHASTRQSQSSSEDVESGDEEVNFSRHLYRQVLRRGEQHLPPEQPPTIENTRSPSDLYSILLTNYPDASSLCWNAFNEIQYHFTNIAEGQESRASEVFGVVLELLQTQGVATLQEIFQSNDSIFRIHIRLLSNILLLIEKNAHRYLKPDDGVVHRVFNPMGVCPFVEMIGLQVLDVVYSQLLPEAWCMSSHRRNEVLGFLSPLRDVLGRVTPMLETVSAFIASKFECQEWRKVESGSQGFVSSVDPAGYRSFLTTGVLPTRTSGKIRFTRFNGVLPRCEIDALWSLLAYFTGSSGPAPETAVRWRLFPVLFFSKAAVLGSEALTPTSADTAPVLAPSRGHLSCCEREISNLSSLLSVGALDPLPPTDDFVVKLVQKSLALQADQYKYDSMTSELLFPSIPTRNDFRSIMRIWEETSLHQPLIPLLENGISFVFSETLACFALYAGNENHGGFASLLPASGILRRSVYFVVSWVQRMPKKKARWSRLNEKLERLIAHLNGTARCIEHEKSSAQTEDLSKACGSFEDAFNSTDKIASIVSAPYQELLYREGAAQLMIALATLKVVCREPGTTNTLPCAPYTKLLRQKVWEMLSDEALRERQRHIIGMGAASQSIGKRPEYVGDALRLHVVAKTMGLLTLSHLGIPSFDTDCNDYPAHSSFDFHPEILDGENPIVFLVSCMISCLDCACDLLTRANHQSASSNFPNTATTPAEPLTRIISCICVWLEKIFTRSHHILVMSKTTPELPIAQLRDPVEDLRDVSLSISANSLRRSIQSTIDVSDTGIAVQICFRACLATLRSALRLASESDIHRKHTACADRQVGGSPRCRLTNVTQPKSAGRQDDEVDFFGNLDDNLFLDIGVDENVGVKGNNDATQSPSGLSTTKELEYSAVSNLFSFLSQLAELSAPTKMYATQTSTSSFAGRSLVARHAGGICSCLAALCIWDAPDKLGFNPSLDALMRPGSTVRSKDDKTYFKHFAQCLSSELCHLALRFPTCMRTVHSYLEGVFHHFVEAMLDSDTLERFPSCNVADSGSQREEMELLRLELAVEEQNRRTSQPDARDLHDVEGRALRRKASDVADGLGHCYTSRNLWSFCQALGQAMLQVSLMENSLVTSNIAMIGNVLLQSDCDLRSAPEETRPASMESECLKRLKKLRGIISVAARFHSRKDEMLSPTSLLTYENVSSIVIASCSYQLIRASEGFQYYDRIFSETYMSSSILEGQTATQEANATKERARQKHAKLLELQNCYAKVTISLLSWILRESPPCCSDYFKQSLKLVSEDFFCRVLQRRAVEVHKALQKLREVSLSGISVNLTSSCSFLIESPPSNIDNHLLDALYEASGKRARELMLHVAMTYTPGGAVDTIFNALMTVGTDATSGLYANGKVLGHAFHCLERPFRYSSTIATNCHLQQAIDEYLSLVDVSREHEPQDIAAIHNLRKLALTHNLLPKLNQEGRELSTKKGVIQVLKYILDFESKCQRLRNGEESVTLKTEFACTVAKGLVLCLCQSIQRDNVDDSMVCDLLECATYLLSLPPGSISAGTIPMPTANLLQWSKSRSTSIDMLRDPSVASTASNSATYIRTFATWLNRFAMLLVDEGREENASLVDAFRRNTVKLKKQRKSMWTDCSEYHCMDGYPKLKLLLENGVLLEEVSRLVFSGKENFPTVRNVYSRKKGRTGEISHTETPKHKWAPSRKVSRAALSFSSLFASIP